MGWGAYATKDMDNALFYFDVETKRLEICDEYEGYKVVWEAAYNDVKVQTGQVDALLRVGGLNCRLCELMLVGAGVPNTYNDLTPAQVQALDLDWDFEYDEKDAWAC